MTRLFFVCILAISVCWAAACARASFSCAACSLYAAFGTQAGRISPTNRIGFLTVATHRYRRPRWSRAADSVRLSRQMPKKSSLRRFEHLPSVSANLNARAGGGDVRFPPIHWCLQLALGVLQMRRLLTLASAGVPPRALTFTPIADRFVGSFMGERSELKWHERSESCQRSYFRNYLPGRILTAAGFIFK